ncbi:unnamed protein product [Lota lota]
MLRSFCKQVVRSTGAVRSESVRHVTLWLTSLPTPVRRRPRWRRMDDEEEDMASQPITSQHWGAVAYRNFKPDEASGQHLPYAPGPALPRCGDGPLAIDRNAQHCDTQSFARSHGTSSPGPHSEPMEDRGDRPALVEEEQRGQEEQEEQQQEEEEEGGDDHGSAARPAERAAVSVEVEIGRKLRDIGDQLNHNHAELRRQREVLPVWMRLAAALLGLLFPREAMVPQLR